MIQQKRTDRNLNGVHIDLVRLCYAVIKDLEDSGDIEIVIVEGLRSVERQQVLLAEGKSSTMNSRHFSGHAIDFAVFKNGEYITTFAEYEKVAGIFKHLAYLRGTPITWGGDWKKWLDGKRDGTHIQLTWEHYPLDGVPTKTPQNSKTVIAATAAPIAALIPEVIDLVDRGAEVVEKAGGANWYVIGTLIVISAFIIMERVKKIRGEGI